MSDELDVKQVILITPLENQKIGQIGKFLDNLRQEINQNVLSASDEFTLNKYLHHLLKIYHPLNISAKGLNEKYSLIQSILRKEGYFTGSDSFQVNPCLNKNELLLQYKLLIQRCWDYVSQLEFIISHEFGFKEENLMNLFRGNSILKDGNHHYRIITPTLKDVGKVFTETKNDPETVENIPDFKFESINQKIHWLHDLGIIDKILVDSSNEDGSYNYSRAANIISSFTEIKPETIRKSIEAIYKPNKSNSKNNPLNNKENQVFIESMRVKFKIDKLRNI